MVQWIEDPRDRCFKMHIIQGIEEFKMADPVMS